MRPGRVSGCIDHVTYMERQMDEQTLADREAKEALKHVRVSFDSVKCLTVAKPSRETQFLGFCVLAEPWPGRTLCLGNRYFMGIMASRTLADPYFTDLGIMASRPLFNLAEPPL